MPSDLIQVNQSEIRTRMEAITPNTRWNIGESIATRYRNYLVLNPRNLPQTISTPSFSRFSPHNALLVNKKTAALQYSTKQPIHRSIFPAYPYIAHSAFVMNNMMNCSRELQASAILYQISALMNPALSSAFSYYAAHYSSWLSQRTTSPLTNAVVPSPPLSSENDKTTDEIKAEKTKSTMKRKAPCPPDNSYTKIKYPKIIDSDVVDNCSEDEENDTVDVVKMRMNVEKSVVLVLSQLAEIDSPHDIATTLPPRPF